MFSYLYSKKGAVGGEGGGLSEEEMRLKRDVEPRWSGTVAYRALVQKERLEALRKDHRALTGFMSVRDFFLFLRECVGRELIFWCVGIV